MSTSSSYVTFGPTRSGLESLTHFNESSEDCVICQDNDTKEDGFVRTGTCRQVYHMSCLEEWKETRSAQETAFKTGLFNCPNCRSELDTRIFSRITKEDVDLNLELQSAIKNRNYRELKSLYERHSELKEDSQKYKVSRSMPLTLAASLGQLPSMVIIHRRGGVVNPATEKLSGIVSPLIAAVAKGQLTAASMLINWGAHINGTAAKRPLNVAMARGNEEMVLFLAEKGANFSLHDSNNITPLTSYYRGVAKRRIKEQRKPFWLKQTTDEDKKELRIVSHAISKGTDLSVSFPDPDSENERITVVNIALKTASTVALKKIIDKAPSSVFMPEQTPLLAPAISSSQNLTIESMTQTISSYFNHLNEEMQNARTGMQLRYPIFDTLDLKGTERFELVLSKTAKATVTAPSALRTPVLTELVKRYTNPKTTLAEIKEKAIHDKILLLFRSGVNPCIFDSELLSPLHYAVREPLTRRSAGMIEYLINAGALTTLGDKEERWPIHHYARTQVGTEFSQKVVEVLARPIVPSELSQDQQNRFHPFSRDVLEKYRSTSARVLAGDDEIKAKLERLIVKPHKNCASFVYNPYSGDDINKFETFVGINIFDKEGKTPLHHAIEAYYDGPNKGKNRKTIQDLLCLGADIHITDNTEKSPKSMSMAHPDDNILKIVYSSQYLEDDARDHSTKTVNGLEITPYYYWTKRDQDFL